MFIFGRILNVTFNDLRASQHKSCFYLQTKEKILIRSKQPFISVKIYSITVCGCFPSSIEHERVFTSHVCASGWMIAATLKWCNFLIQHVRGFCHAFRVLKLRDLPSGSPRTAIVLLELMFVNLKKKTTIYCNYSQ
jgi:hypothetical protein